MRVSGYGIDLGAVWRKQLAAGADRASTVRTAGSQAPLSLAEPRVSASAWAGPADAVSRLDRPTGPSLVQPAEKTPGPTFSELLRQVSGADSVAQQSVDKYVRGNKPLHETMIALTKADINLRLLVNVRNKVLDAYREVMRMS